MTAYVRGQIIIDEVEHPRGTIPSLEQAEPICEEAECNIPWVLEVLVRHELVVDMDKCLAERPVAPTIHDIANVARDMHVILRSIPHLFGGYEAGEETAESRFKG